MAILSRVFKVGLLAYALYFVVGALCAPYAAHTHQFELADEYYNIFSASCQQQASRSFWFYGYPMALCARCLGNYIGFIVAGLFWLLKPQAITKKLFLLLFVLGLGEKIAEFLGWAGNNEVRFVAGLFLGGAILFGLALFVQFVWRIWKKYVDQEIHCAGA